jgi:hypothetical protein
MSVSPSANPAHKSIRGDRFAMLGGAGLVVVLGDLRRPRRNRRASVRRRMTFSDDSRNTGLSSNRLRIANISVHK